MECPPLMNPRSYDADVLRSQLAILRKAAADRSAQEKAIRSAYDSAVQTAATEQRTATDSLQQERAAEIESLKKEYADKLAHLAAKVAAERTKLDEQRAQAATQITRQADAQEKKLHDDDQFEETQAREVAKEKKKKPQRLFLKSEQELGKIAGALEDCENRSRSFVATTCGSAGGGEPVAEVPTTAKPGRTAAIPTAAAARRSQPPRNFSTNLIEKPIPSIVLMPHRVRFSRAAAPR